MNLSRVTLTQLGYLVAVERERSFRDAAKRSFVTQPALSQQIGKLEEELGVRVFDRSRQPVVPTEIGERILAQARAILREVERLGDVVAESAGPLSGRYRLGILPTLAPSLVPLFLPDFMRRHSLVELVVEEVTTEEMIERLRRDDLDGGLAATPLHTTEIAERPLYREPLHAYVSPGHPLARRRRIDQRELAKEPVWILGEGHCFREQVLQLCGPRRPVVAGGSGAVAFESATFETLIGLVDRDFGSTVLPDLVVRALLAAKRRERVRPFAPPVPSREVSLVSRRRHLRRAIADALAAAIEAAVPPELVASRRDRSRPLDPRPSGRA
ncbi:MAG: hydrogen peroxide-inducible genes activator [Deltaproteobacteria bacterium]|nr:hydrogen peroxide-inducible genes activator [Deltaproteobacteria bacterium]